MLRRKLQNVILGKSCFDGAIRHSFRQKDKVAITLNKVMIKELDDSVISDLQQVWTHRQQRSLRMQAPTQSPPDSQPHRRPHTRTPSKAINNTPWGGEATTTEASIKMPHKACDPQACSGLLRFAQACPSCQDLLRFTQPQTQVYLITAQFNTLYAQFHKRKLTLVRSVSPKENIAY
jgi:hypothetical protein